MRCSRTIDRRCNFNSEPALYALRAARQRGARLTDCAAQHAGAKRQPLTDFAAGEAPLDSARSVIDLHLRFGHLTFESCARCDQELELPAIGFMRKRHGLIDAVLVMANYI